MHKRNKPEVPEKSLEDIKSISNDKSLLAKFTEFTSGYVSQNRGKPDIKKLRELIYEVMASGNLLDPFQNADEKTQAIVLEFASTIASKGLKMKQFQELDTALVSPEVKQGIQFIGTLFEATAKEPNPYIFGTMEWFENLTDEQREQALVTCKLAPRFFLGAHDLFGVLNNKNKPNIEAAKGDKKQNDIKQVPNDDID